MGKVNEVWRDILGPDISRDLDDLAEAHHGADRVTMIQKAVISFIHADCSRNSGVADAYIFQKTHR